MSNQPSTRDDLSRQEEHKQLTALFDEMKKNQLTFLDEAGKRIIELSTGLLGVLFAVIAFGDKFPPSYIAGKPLTQGLLIIVLSVFVTAILFGVLTVQPRKYDYNDRSLTDMREKLKDLLAYKSLRMKAATWLFFAGTVLLAVLISSVVWGV